MLTSASVQVEQPATVPQYQVDATDLVVGLVLLTLSGWAVVTGWLAQRSVDSVVSRLNELDAEVKSLRKDQAETREGLRLEIAERVRHDDLTVSMGLLDVRIEKVGAQLHEQNLKLASLMERMRERS